MEVVGTTLLVGAAILGSLYRLIIKVSGDRLALLGGLNAVSVVVGLVGIWFVPPLGWTAVPYLLVSSGAYTVAMTLLMHGYQHGEFGVITPLQDTFRVLMAAALAVLVLREDVRSLHWVAVALVAVALLVQRPAASSVLRRGHGRSVALGIGAGLASGVQYAVDVAGVRSVDASQTYVVWNLLIGLPIVVAAVATRPSLVRTRLRSEGWRIAGGSLLDMTGYAIMLFVAYGLALVEILPVFNLRILFSTVLGVLALREGMAARRITASGLLLAAAVVVQFA